MTTISEIDTEAELQASKGNVCANAYQDAVCGSQPIPISYKYIALNETDDSDSAEIIDSHRDSIQGESLS